MYGGCSMSSCSCYWMLKATTSRLKATTSSHMQLSMPQLCWKLQQDAENVARTCELVVYICTYASYLAGTGQLAAQHVACWSASLLIHTLTPMLVCVVVAMLSAVQTPMVCQHL
eukprot:GHRR01017900.1.p1 GENE.GHRR01017900.1~~GHRR01017900.1.p1  ORF type:complete len:114 (+),score=34.03 GHRR01017900.1:1361-1702(+)